MQQYIVIAQNFDRLVVDNFGKSMLKVMKVCLVDAWLVWKEIKNIGG